MGRKLVFFLFLPLLAIVGSLVSVKTAQKALVVSACSDQSFTGNFKPTGQEAIFEGRRVAAPLAATEIRFPVLGVTAGEEKWIEVDLSEQKLKAWEGDKLFLETAIASGLPWWPTPTGEFRIWVKLRYTTMEGGSGKYYYNLPNVPYVMYFEGSGVPSWKGFGLHGTYWHNSFGTPRSHGCVNLPTPVAEKLYYWVSPILPDGKRSVFASGDNLGTRIVIHE